MPRVRPSFYSRSSITQSLGGAGTMTTASRLSATGEGSGIQPPVTMLATTSTDETEFTERFILNNGMKDNDDKNNVAPLETTETMDTEYSLEAKPTRATLAETFSSGENTQAEANYGGFQNENANTTNHPAGTDSVAQPGMYESASYSSDDGESSTSYSSGEEFINLAHEAKMTNRVDSPDRTYTGAVVGGASGSVTTQNSGGSYYYKDQHGTMHLEYVDSEEEQAFSFGTRSREGEYVHDDQDVYSGQNSAGEALHDRASKFGLDHRGGSFEATSEGYQTAADCSKTLNTNLETLHTDLEGVNYIPTMNEHDMMVHDPAYHVHKGYTDNVGAEEGESYAEDYDRLMEGGSYLYEDDGTRFTGYDYEDGTYTERLHDEDGTYTEHTLNDEDGTYTEHTYHDNMTEYTQDTRTTYDDENTRVMSQLMDSYLSDRSTESWEEGSFASASRAISRIDSAGDDDDAVSEPSYGDSEFYSDDDDDGDSTLFGLLKKKFQDLKGRSSNTDDDGEGDDEIGFKPEGGKSRRKSNQTAEKKRFSIGKKSRRKSNKDMESLFGRIGEIGLEFLNETIDQASKSPRRSRKDRDQSTRIVTSLRDIFSCGAPSRY